MMGICVGDVMRDCCIGACGCCYIGVCGFRGEVLSDCDVVSDGEWISTLTLTDHNDTHLAAKGLRRRRGIKEWHWRCSMHRHAAERT
jgi:hypothetical protein